MRASNSRAIRQPDRTCWNLAWRRALVASSLIATGFSCGGSQTGSAEDISASDMGASSNPVDANHVPSPSSPVDTGPAQLIEELRGTAARARQVASAPTSASDDGWAFGWKLYAAEARPEQNVLFSPYSISLAGAMLVAGAGGETKSEIDAALSFTNDTGSDFHQARNTVAQALEARNHSAGADQNAQSLHVSNDLWLDRSYRPAATYLDVLSAYYGANASLLDFSEQVDSARSAINQKVARDTQQLIPELLAPGSLQRATTCVLTNSLYFKANWAASFDPADTQQDLFVTTAGTNAPVSIMYRTFQTGYVASPEYEAIRLAYSGHELELIAIMPRRGTFAEFVGTLSAERALAISSELTNGYTNVALGFPKFKLEYRLPLKDRLQQLGMKLAFEPGADFDEELGDPVYLADAFHQATIAIDEQGTEAAAASAFEAIAISKPPPPISVTFDHPFVYFVRDRATNALLFVGQLVTP